MKTMILKQPISPRRKPMTQPHVLQTDLDISSEAAKRLTQNLRLIEKGSSDVIRTPFMKDVDAQAVLGEWDKVFQPISGSLDEKLLELENQQRAKFGPRSIAKPWKERKSSLEDYFKPYEGKGDPTDLVGNTTHRSDLRPISIQRASNLLKRQTSSGLPFMVKKGLVIKEVTNDLDGYYDRRDPYVLFTRTQEGGKTRNVWGDAIARTLMQQRYFSPLLDFQRKEVWRSSLNGPDATADTVTSIFARAMTSGRELISIDFSSYDASVKPQLVDIFTNYLKSIFQNSYSHEIEMVMDDIVNIGIVTPDGIMNGVHGNPSGNSFTLEINSVVQRSIALFLDDMDDALMSVTGDDGLYAIHPYQYDDIIGLFKSFGLEVNADKSHFSRDYAVYLQNYYSRTYNSKGRLNPIYPVYRALLRIVFQERWSSFTKYDIPGEDYYAIRTICILENCKFHPMFKQLVEFVNKHFSLYFSQSSLGKYLLMVNEAKGSAGILNNQYSDRPQGIRSFSTVKLLGELS